MKRPADPANGLAKALMARSRDREERLQDFWEEASNQGARPSSDLVKALTRRITRDAFPLPRKPTAEQKRLFTLSVARLIREVAPRSALEVCLKVVNARAKARSRHNPVEDMSRAVYGRPAKRSAGYIPGVLDARSRDLLAAFENANRKAGNQRDLEGLDVEVVRAIRERSGISNQDFEWFMHDLLRDRGQHSDGPGGKNASGQRRRMLKAFRQAAFNNKALVEQMGSIPGLG